MSLFSTLGQLLHTGWLGRWRRRHALAFGLTVGVILGVVLTLTATYLVKAVDNPELEHGDLVILSGRDDSDGAQRQKLVDQWNTTHPQNRARIIELPPHADQAYAQMVASAQSQKPDIDIYNLDVTLMAEFADYGYIRPLDESTVDTSEFLRNPIQTCRYRNKLWALPFNTNAGLLYYRTGLVTAPGSWPQMISSAEGFFANSNHDPRVQAGYTGQLFEYEGRTVNALEAIQAAAHGDMVRNGKVAVELEDIQRGINWLRPSTAQGIVLPDSLTYDEQLSTQAFREGKVLFMRNWPVAYRDITSPGDDGKPPVPFEVTPLPGNSVLGGENLAVAANSTKPKAAQALIEFLTDARSQQILFERGGLAATREVVYRDSAVRDKYKYTDILLQSIQLARPRPVTRCYRQFSETFQVAIDQALREAKPLPDDFIDTLNKVLTC
jgi:ABC-type glycerol-3-phosphate transport system substrate-binding protein